MPEKVDKTSKGAGKVSHARGTPVRVLVVTPVGVEGRGGIDRLNSYLDTWVRETAAPVQLTFLGSRGEWRGPFWLVHFLFAILRFAGVLIMRRHDLVHIHVSTDGSALRKVVFGRVARLARMPFVIHYHGMMSADILANNPLWLRALRILASDAQGVILLGHAFRDPFLKGLGCAAEKISIIHNGVPDAGSGAAIPREAIGPARILLAGEVGERKGVDVLLDSLAALNASEGGAVVDWTCVIAGNGDIEHWRARAAALGLGPMVTFTGWIEADCVRAYMRDADIIVLPSRVEALPLSLIEGASAGAVLVATDVGAVRDIVVDGMNGLIVEHDAGQLAKALMRLMSDRDLLAQMQIQSRAHYCSGFSMQRYGSAIVMLYKEIVLQSR